MLLLKVSTTTYAYTHPVFWGAIEDSLSRRMSIWSGSFNKEKIGPLSHVEKILRTTTLER